MLLYTYLRTCIPLVLDLKHRLDVKKKKDKMFFIGGYAVIRRLYNHVDMVGCTFNYRLISLI